MKISNLEKELTNANELLEVSRCHERQLTSQDDAEIVSSAAATVSRLIKSGMTLTQVNNWILSSSFDWLEGRPNWLRCSMFWKFEILYSSLFDSVSVWTCLQLNALFCLLLNVIFMLFFRSTVNMWKFVVLFRMRKMRINDSVIIWIKFYMYVAMLFALQLY